MMLYIYIMHDLAYGEHTCGIVAASWILQVAASPSWHQCGEMACVSWYPAARRRHTSDTLAVCRCSAQLTAILRPNCGVEDGGPIQAAVRWARAGIR